MFGRPQSFLYVVFGISIGLTISMLTSSMNGVLWNNLVVRRHYADHDHDPFNIPGIGRGYTEKYIDPDENEHQNNDSHHHHGELRITLLIKPRNKKYFLVIIIIMACQQHRFLWLSLDICPYLLDNTQWLHTADELKFLLIDQHWCVHE